MIIQNSLAYCRNCRTIFLLCLSILLPCVLLAQESLTFVAERDTVAHRSRDRSETVIIYAGDLIATNVGVHFGTIRSPRGYQNEFHLVIILGEPSDQYLTFAKDFRPFNTEDVFGDDIFIDYPLDRPDPNFIDTWGNPPAAIADTMWVPHYYADILRGQDRNMLLEIQPGLEIRDDWGTPWYEHPEVNLQHGRAMFYNAAIRLGTGTSIAVRNIRRAEFVYVVDGVISSQAHQRWPSTLFYGCAFFDAYHPGDALTLLLFLDGDYLDIYTEGTDIHVGTFIRVGREFQIQYQSLIRHNTSDLTNVQWPQRAGVIRRLPPPVVEIAVLVEIEEEPVAVQVEDVAIVAIEAPPVAVIENAPTTGAMPLWAWFAIGGG
ncbi:MAG: hypothetical protein FWE20_11845, partial [Defluviitaleaceae bacterium]|nr:hypothetical protein [Defluviitaleaceae bacterium]